MANNLIKSFFAILLLCYSAPSEASTNFSSTSFFNFEVVKPPPVLTITRPSPSIALMSWTPFSSLSPYTVTVTDQTTATVLASFITSGTTAKVGGIIRGHTIVYRVQSDKIILELVTTG